MNTRPTNPKSGEYVEGWKDNRQNYLPISHKGTIGVSLSERLEIIKQYKNHSCHSTSKIAIRRLRMPFDVEKMGLSTSNEGKKWGILVFMCST